MEVQNEIYKLLFENSGQGMLVTNKIGIIELVNPKLLEMFHYKEEELLSQSIEILVPDAAKKRHESHREKYTDRPKDREMGGDMSLKGQRKDGSEFSVEVGLSHCHINDELKVVAIVTDITERMLSQNRLAQINVELEQNVKTRTLELEKSQKLYNLIACNFPRGIINVFDRELNYIFTEGQELDKLGLNSQDLIGKNYLTRFNETQATLISDKLSNVFNGDNISFEFKNGANFYVVNAVPLKGNDGEVEQILVIEKNITDSKIAQQEIIKNLEKEKQLNELKTRFVSMASHEFRTPLSTILSSATLAEKYPSETDQDKRLKHLDRIKSSVKNLTSILNDFLSIDKLEEGKVEVHNTKFVIDELIYEAAEEMEPYLKKEQQIKVNSSLKNQEINSDQHVIKNILINLLSNASKYSDAGKIIQLNLSATDVGVKIDIVDQGMGIPEKEQDQLFSRFFRAGNVTNIEGTGLGLNIVKKYLSLVNGEISFESKEGIGTTFSITIPNTLL